jgi:HEAT repeat protein
MMDDKAAPEDVIASAKRLVAADMIAEAQNLLLEEGYVKRLEPAIQKAYLRLVPVSPTLREMLDEVYRDLDDPSPDVRFKAVTKIAREFNKERLRDKTRWMRDPRASEPLIKAADDPDTRVSERALGTLARLVCKYFPDQRTLPAFRAKLTDQRQETRTFAVSGIAGLRHEELLEDLVDLLDRGTEKDRSDVSAQIWGASIETFHNTNQHPIEWSEPGRRFWRDKMIGALRDPFVNVTKHAARALMGLGDRNAILALRAARDAEDDADVAYEMDRAIAGLKEGT